MSLPDSSVSFSMLSSLIGLPSESSYCTTLSLLGPPLTKSPRRTEWRRRERERYTERERERARARARERERERERESESERERESRKF